VSERERGRCGKALSHSPVLVNSYIQTLYSAVLPRSPDEQSKNEGMACHVECGSQLMQWVVSGMPTL